MKELEIDREIFEITNEDSQQASIYARRIPKNCDFMTLTVIKNKNKITRMYLTFKEIDTNA